MKNLIKKIQEQVIVLDEKKRDKERIKEEKNKRKELIEKSISIGIDLLDGVKYSEVEVAPFAENANEFSKLLNDNQIRTLSEMDITIVSYKVISKITKAPIEETLLVQNFNLDDAKNIVLSKINSVLKQEAQDAIVDTINLSGTDKLYVTKETVSLENSISVENAGVKLTEEMVEDFEDNNFQIVPFTKTAQGVNKDIDYKYHILEHPYGAVMVFLLNVNGALVAKLKRAPGINGGFQLLSGNMEAIHQKIFKDVISIFENNKVSVHYEGKTPKNTDTVLKKYQESSTLFNQSGYDSDIQLISFDKLADIKETKKEAKKDDEILDFSFLDGVSEGANNQENLKYEFNDENLPEF